MLPAVALPTSVILFAVLHRLLDEHVTLLVWDFIGRHILMTMWDLLKRYPSRFMWTAWGLVGADLLISVYTQAVGGSFWAFAFCPGSCLLPLAIALTIFALVSGSRTPRRQAVRAPVQANPYVPPQQPRSELPPQTSSGSDSMDY